MSSNYRETPSKVYINMVGHLQVDNLFFSNLLFFKNQNRFDDVSVLSPKRLLLRHSYEVFICLLQTRHI